MPHKIEPGALPNIVVMTVYGEIEQGDFISVDDLGMNDTPKYLLVDASKLGLGLPDDFLSSARQTPILHRNCLHAAVVVRSDLLKNLAVVVIKLARVRDKVSFFASYDEAMNHLVGLARQTPG
jgi:hypothetical protein